MSQTYVLKTTGFVVKFTAAFTNIVIDTKGFLSEFTYSAKHFKFRTTSEFKKTHRKRSGLIGYFVEATFLAYIQNVEDEVPPVLNDVRKTKFIFDEFTAKAGEEVSINILDFGPPFNYYYKRKKVVFNVEEDSRTHAVKRYRDEEKDAIIIPTSAVVTQDNPNPPLNDTPRGHFYDKNLGSIINSWTISDDEKMKYAEVTTLMAFLIYDIERKIIPKILSPSSLSAVNDTANNTNTDISNLSLIQQTIFTLKKTWGYFFVANSSLPHRQAIPAILPAIPDYEAFLIYYKSLANFYKSLYIIQDGLLSKSENERIGLLIKVLPYSALNIIPYNVRIEVLKTLMTLSGLSEGHENLALNVIHSITVQDADRFLDFLLEKSNGSNTNFEQLYENMDDERLSRYPVVSWFITEASNRKYFTYAVYSLWKVSKYNSSYIPPGVTPLENGVNPNAFFITPPGSEYYENDTNYVIAYSPEQMTSYGIIATGITTTIGIKITYQSEINGIFIKVNQLTKSSATTTGPPGGFGGSGAITKTDPFGNYHLYQAIALVNYQPDVEIELPQSPLMPAFLFHYIEEFDRIKDFDAGFTLAINITIEAVLFYFTAGGFSLLKDLRYLKYVNRIGRAMRAELTPVATLEVWRGLEAGGQVLSLSSSILYSVSVYFVTTENDPARRAVAERLSNFFLLLTFASAGGAIYSRVKAARAADDVLEAINALPPTVPHGLHQDVIDLLYAVKNSKDVSLILIRNKITSLDFGIDINRILIRFDDPLFTESDKLAFFKDFNHLNNTTDILIWKELNYEYIGTVNPLTTPQTIRFTLVDIWKADPTKFRNSIEYLSGIARFKYLKYSEVRHIREVIGIDGGHLNIHRPTTDLSSPTLWKIVPQSPSYSTTIPLLERTDIIPVNGHTVYKNSWRFNSNNVGGYLLDGQTVSKKLLHYIIDPSWDEEKLVQEMAFAWSRKVQHISPLINSPTMQIIQGTNHFIFTKLYRSYFSDGTKIEFLYRSAQIDIFGVYQIDHVSLMRIVLNYTQ